MKLKIIFAFLIGLSVLTAGCAGSESVPAKAIELQNSGDGNEAVKLAVFCGFRTPFTDDNIPSPVDLIKENFTGAAALRKTLNGEYKPGLFASYECKVDELGRLVVEGVWRDGLKWHDNTDFKPEEWENSLMKRKQDMQMYGHDIAEGITEIKHYENKSVIVFESDSVKYLDLLSMNIYKESKSDPDKKEKENKDGWSSKEPKIPSVGIGPYKFKEYLDKNGLYSLYVPFEYFYDNNASYRAKNVLLEEYYDIEKMLSAVRDGKYHWAQFPSGISSGLSSMGIEGLRVEKYETNSYLSLLLNTKSEAFKDVRVRKALDLLIDKEKLKDHFSAGCEPYDAFVKDESAAERLARGENLLSEAGVGPTSPLNLTILIQEENSSRKHVVKSIGEMLAKYNINIKSELVSWSEMINGRLSKGNYSAALVSLYLPSNGNWGGVFGTKGLKENGMNYTGLALKDSDEIFSKLDSAAGKQVDLNLKQKVFETFEEEMPAVFLLKTYDMALINGGNDSKLKFAEEIEKPAKGYTYWNSVLNWPCLYGGN